jgi:hypothetical protein
VPLTRDGRLARITLDRPAAFNALTLAMVRDVDAALDACSPGGRRPGSSRCPRPGSPATSRRWMAVTWACRVDCH